MVPALQGGNTYQARRKQFNIGPANLSHLLPLPRAYSKEFFGVHSFKSSCMMSCTNSVQSNNKLEQTSWKQHYFLIKLNLCLKINATGNPGCTLCNSGCTVSAENTLRIGPAPSFPFPFTFRFFFPSPPLPLPLPPLRNSLPWIQLESLGSRVSSPTGSGAEPQRISILVHFSLIICHLAASDLLIFLRSTTVYAFFHLCFCSFSR